MSVTCLSNCTERTNAYAKTASVTLSCVYAYRSFGVDADRGTAELHTKLALAAVLGDLATALVLDRLKKRAGALSDDDRYVVTRGLLANNLFKCLEVKGIADRDVLDTERVAEFDEIYLTGSFTANRLTSGGVFLMSRHSRDRVIENDNGVCALVVDDV